MRGESALSDIVDTKDTNSPYQTDAYLEGILVQPVGAIDKVLTPFWYNIAPCVCAAMACIWAILPAAEVSGEVFHYILPIVLIEPQALKNGRKM